MPRPDPVMALLERRLDAVKRASPFELVPAVKEFVETAAALLRDNRARIERIERAIGPLDAVM